MTLTRNTVSNYSTGLTAILSSPGDRFVATKTLFLK